MWNLQIAKNIKGPNLQNEVDQGTPEVNTDT